MKPFNPNIQWDHEEWLSELKRVQSLPSSPNTKILFKQLRSLIFKVNIEIVNIGYYTNNLGRKVFLPDVNSYSYLYSTPISIQNKYSRMDVVTNVKVVNDDSIDAAEKLAKEGYNPAVLILACEDGPGGGVIGGCYGQEEGLFRRTNLYVYMYPFSKHASEYGLLPKKDKYPLDKCFGGVYVYNSIVFREQENLGYALKEHPFPMSFIAVPALRDPQITIEGILTIEDSKIEKEKIKTILRIGLINGHDSLVLGAWGCGIFHNPPSHISNLFKIILDEEEFKNKFRVILFAILEDDCSCKSHNPNGNFIPFYNTFK